MRILIIEDEKEIADGIESVLQRKNYTTDAVYDGICGLDVPIILLTAKSQRKQRNCSSSFKYRQPYQQRKSGTSF